jgi:hypothetical protein
MRKFFKGKKDKNKEKEIQNIATEEDEEVISYPEEDLSTLDPQYKEFVPPQSIQESLDKVDSLLLITARALLKNKIDLVNLNLPENLRELLLAQKCNTSYFFPKIVGTWNRAKVTGRVALSQDLRTASTGSLVKVWDGNPIIPSYYNSLKVPPTGRLLSVQNEFPLQMISIIGKSR